MPKLRKPKPAAQGNGHICVYAVIAVVAVLVAAYVMSSSSEPRQKPPHTMKPQPNRNRKESAKIFAEAFELYSKQDMSAAAKRFEDYLRLEPKDVSALNNLGLVHTELSDFDAAIGSFKRALAIDTAHADAHSNLGIAYGKAGRAHESRAAYAAALRANPRHANAAGNLALELTKAEPPRWQEAVAVLEAVLGQEEGGWRAGSTSWAHHKLPSRCAVTIHTGDRFNRVYGGTTLTGYWLVITSSSFLPFRVNSFPQSAPNEASRSHP